MPNCAVRFIWTLYCYFFPLLKSFSILLLFSLSTKVFLNLSFGSVLQKNEEKKFGIRHRELLLGFLDGKYRLCCGIPGEAGKSGFSEAAGVSGKAVLWARGPSRLSCCWKLVEALPYRHHQTTTKRDDPGVPGSQDCCVNSAFPYCTAQTAYHLSNLNLKQSDSRPSRTHLVSESILSRGIVPTSIRKEDRKSTVIHIQVKGVLKGS